MIACAVDGETDFAPVCGVEKSTGERGTTLTISGPSGTFRRLLVTDDGRGVIAADGAEAAVVAVLDKGLIEVALGGDRYRLQATIKPFASKAQ